MKQTIKYCLYKKCELLRMAFTNMLNKTKHWTIQSLHMHAQFEVKIVRATNIKDIEGFFKIIECNSGLCLKICTSFLSMRICRLRGLYVLRVNLRGKKTVRIQSSH